MKERTLLKIALSCTIAGIISLLFLSEITEIDFYTINEIKQLDDTQVRTDGTVEKVTNRGNITIITLSRKESIDVIAFDKINISKGNIIEITGKTDEYNGKKEIILDSLNTFVPN